MSYKKQDRADVEVGEATPLLGHDEPPPLQEMQAESLKERAVAGTAAVSFVTSILSVILEAAAHPTVWISGILGMVLAPYAALQQSKLTQVEALNQTNERLESEVEELSLENNRLAKQVQEMEETVLNLQAMEETLETLQSVQGQSVSELERQLQESRDILSTMDRNLQAEILQNLLSVVLQGDADGDLLLADAEIDDIVNKLEGIHGVQLKEDLLRQIVIEQGRSLPSIMAVAKNLLDEDVAPEHNIFSFVQDDDDDEKKK